MNHGIVIIGSGFAARQLVKNIRKRDGETPIALIASDSADDYNKPELSHAISQAQTAAAMTRQRAAEFAKQCNVQLFPHTAVTKIDAQAKRIFSEDNHWQYDSLVLATGACAIRPPIPGADRLLTLNSLCEYQACEPRLRNSRRIVIIGGGLIGCELAMDFRRAGKQVTLIDRTSSLLASLLPVEISARLMRRLTETGVEVLLNQSVTELTRDSAALRLSLASGRVIEADEAVAAVGLRPCVTLAQNAGLTVKRGIVVDESLCTSHAGIYALGDCAEINGAVRPFLQPAQFAAMALAKTLTGEPTPLRLPAMLVKVKTPELPLQLAGETQREDLHWQIATDAHGLIAKGFDAMKSLRAFVVSEDNMPAAFTLLRELSV
ncbi:NADH:flavorubredoxin reductase NorW [Erwinia sp. HR93]|uniref:NADH:flavorubredoxin reductase NorW n=1 Tax=Erwinia sp. HR93 TaxID=3094840 RepID=UPI002ADED671|nr:NADH:flavorubredoxin reductase NorW [Erwinia sp. HR93]MEA1065285.1 NADH:flavorubredoxin reductase NorW [Erwinia sp. HR93]